MSNTNADYATVKIAHPRRVSDKSAGNSVNIRVTPDVTQLSRSDRRHLKVVANRAAVWFNINGRKFPWREPSASKYERICVEVLLKRTRAETVAAYYGTFFRRLPSWASINDATISELENMLKPLGLWKRRAAALGALASVAVTWGGIFPKNREELQLIPAVGQYVANAILLFQHHQPAPLLDTNMARVIERYLRPRKLADIRHDPWLQTASSHLVISGDPIAVNWAILDIGGTTCTLRAPRCNACPLRRGCSFVRRNLKLNRQHVDERRAKLVTAGLPLRGNISDIMPPSQRTAETNGPLSLKVKDPNGIDCC